MVKRALFNWYVSLNMLLCAVLFAPWAMPRETISGLIGRWVATESGSKQRIGLALRLAVDRLYFWEPNHCVETYKVEEEARRILYP